ncbi:DUF2189 domain-containing protein [Phyllobacterium sp. 0TCS1.6C]|uniref:DUF2189 domain-containing protein n=1 Tax=unclassified Phyllobacterium TaxID=2638441 RepID=UPI002263F60D|nr:MULTISPECIES: DUF2189 domain-containing protein [unclassified Phyllobacterium]MCX8281484.1 DUF2189 domain-containing protein [Phyllobacterium sp. 0TCS1.6C]MCX8292920.1 DUF2189 domain-containing protein [Phyllobacterium sp. 0TCS1.6A]
MAHFHVIAGDGETIIHPEVREIGFSDIFTALRRGLGDFWAKPSHYVFLCLIYPVAGLVLLRLSAGANALPLVFPLMSGFALIGPVAALGLYEISRRRELDMDASWRHATNVVRSPALPSIIAVGVMLFATFLAWLLTAQAVYTSHFGDSAPASLAVFLDQLFTTPEGWNMMLVGNAIGFVFALFVLCTTVVAFPLLLDRDVGAYAAVATSARAVFTNPLPMLLWGLIVAVLLAVGFLTLFVGLAIIIPVLGHATWHLYRAVVVSPHDEARR